MDIKHKHHKNLIKHRKRKPWKIDKRHQMQVQEVQYDQSLYRSVVVT